MGTDIDWQHELDSSFGHGDDVPPAHYVAAGHRVVRRRRAASVAIVAAMTVGVGAAWASGPGGAPRGEAPVATQPPTPSETSPTTSEAEARRLEQGRARTAALDSAASMGTPAALTYDGLFLVPEAGPVLERVPNPMGYSAGVGRSVGLRVTMPDGERYALLVVHADGGTSAIVVRASGDFEGWLAGAVRSQRSLDVANGVTPSVGDTDDQPWLVLATNRDGVAGARPGVVVVEQRIGVDLGDGFPGGASAVRLVVDGRSEFAVYRVVDGELEVIPAGGGFDSMDAFLEWARAQYSSGAGMR